MLLNDDAGTMDPKQAQQRAQEAGERRDPASSLPWLFPWLLAFTGMLITLALMR
jgi:hypothetical protein